MQCRLKSLCVFAALLALGSIEVRSNIAAAQSPPHLTKTCSKLYKSWLKHESYGAFATSPTGHCGFGSRYKKRKGARTAALEECRKIRSGTCKIVAEH